MLEKEKNRSVIIYMYVGDGKTPEPLLGFSGIP